MVDPLSVGAGALVGAVASDAYSDIKERAKAASGSPDAIDAHLAQLQMIAHTISLVEKYLREDHNAACMPEDERVVSLPAASSASYPSQAGYTLRRRGYKHISVLCLATTTVVVKTQIGVVNFSLAAGWNALDLPDNVVLWAQGATPVNIIVRWGDTSLDIAGV